VKVQAVLDVEVQFSKLKRSWRKDVRFTEDASLASSANDPKMINCRQEINSNLNKLQFKK